MATREEYNACVGEGLRGKTGIGQEERKELFCITSKLCSGKAQTEAEAKKLCAEAAANPKPKKTGISKKRTKFCTLRDLDAVAACTAQNIDLSTLTEDNMQEMFSAALKKCSEAKAVGLKKTQKGLEKLSPEEMEALRTVALISKQSEGRAW